MWKRWKSIDALVESSQICDEQLKCMGYNRVFVEVQGTMMTKLCKDKKKAEQDAVKVSERKANGKKTFVCKKCHRESHKEDHLCDPKKA